MEIRNQRLSDEEFFRERQEVLAEWPTGKEVDLDEAIEYHKSMPPSKNYALKVAEAKRKGEVLLSVAEGADTLERHIELLQAAQDEGQADLLSTWTDALTRNHRFAEAEKAVKEAERTSKVVLNGFPIVHYGVAGARQIVESVTLPVDVHGNAPDMRLMAEIALAGGFTKSNLAGAFSSFFGYTKNLPLATVIRNNQYYYRLEGYYEARGVPIQVWASASASGGASGTTPPSLILTLTIIGSLLAAEQGVKHLELATGDGNMVQWLGSAIACRKLAREYLDKFGHQDVEIICMNSGHPGGGRFPTDAAQAFAVLGWHPILAVLGGCEVCSFYTIDEGRQVPRKEACVATLRHNRMMLNMWRNQNINLRSNKDVLLEAEMVEREVRAILNRVIELGDGDVAIGSIRAVEAGILDVPFAASQRTLGKVLSVFDAQGAIRYLDHGNLPFTRDIVEFHKEKIAERSKKEGREVGYDTVVGDIFALSRGHLLSHPGWQAEEVMID